MANSEKALADNPKAALEAYINDLEEIYDPWYESEADRYFYFWNVAQFVAIVSGFGTSVLAALLKTDQVGSFSWGRILLIVLPFLGSLASTSLIQMRVLELLGLRERGRQRIQYLIETGMVRFAAATTPVEYTEIHNWLIAEVATLEREQSRGFFHMIRKENHKSKRGKY